MKGWIIEMIKFIANGASADIIDELGQTPQQFSKETYEFVAQINSAAVKPVVAILLSIVFTMELARVSTKIDGDRTLGVKMVAASMFKMALILPWFYHKICIFSHESLTFSSYPPSLLTIDERMIRLNFISPT